MEYKGYTARPEYSAEDQVFFGRLLGIDDLVDFCSENAKELEAEFHKAVDGYLELCAEIGKEPSRPYSGQLNVRIPPELHREIAAFAQALGVTLNEAVDLAIRAMVQN